MKLEHAVANEADDDCGPMTSDVDKLIEVRVTVMIWNFEDTQRSTVVAMRTRVG
jgi:hypothetical protein